MNRYIVTVYTNEFIFTPDNGPMRRTIDIRVITKSQEKELGKYIIGLPKFESFWNSVLFKYGFFHPYNRNNIKITMIEHKLDSTYKELDEIKDLDFKDE